MWWLLGLGLLGLTVATLALADVFEWFDRHNTIDASYGELIRRRLGNGDYRVVAGVFNQHSARIAAQEWSAEELDDELHARFGGRDTVHVEL